ncbi:hypothetical protein AAG614_00905 [Citromicrobium bathyomarinum]|jgi:hypothetical protein|uniref:hypothetical protein n=1 Tax=Sphingomonadales TaxID=204457 RepID=UPI0006C8F080|nr:MULTISPECIES: hypothetical protein [Sphingomonadales]MAO04682.1 hypothetical protein [Citromicrobium sp.]KPM23294.1 hypothetical protein AAJ72_10415 [Citromicrobium sp. RCC1885]KPM26701.1 hypothetical protein AAJ74_11155 [Citromicrobium sp. RCC1878]MAY78023.1 hypothetical protein [Citromicrobium sp.]MCD1623711.1 hypothetical protein [Citromicrobium bathyomarinum]
MHAAVRLIAPAAAVLALSACAKPGDLVVNQGVGVTAVRSLCPAVGIPDYTGDITTFSSPTSRLARDMDVEATMTNLRTTCDEQGERIYANATFDVYATRSDTRGARTVELPYFSVVLRGGSSVVTKKVGTVRIAFADGQDRAVGQGQAGAFINRADATLPADVRERITRERKAGDEDAALDPLADPEVRAAVQAASFELLVGFQLSDEQLAYNATR